MIELSGNTKKSWQYGAIAWMAQNPIAANLLMLIVFFAGFLAIGDIKKEVFPRFPSQIFTVTVAYPGSSPEEVEQGITIKIEEALRDIIGIKEIRSVSKEGLGIVTVEMEVHADVTKALNQAKVRVDSITGFPLDAERPVVEEVISSGRAMRVSLSGNDEYVLKRLAEQVRDEILALQGISQVEVRGDRDYEISIEISTVNLRRYNLSFDQVVNIVRNHSADIPSGTLRTADGNITLRSLSQARTGEEFANIILLSANDGMRIRLGDIATIRDGFVEQPVLSSLNGQRVVTLVVERVENQDVLHITEQLRSYIKDKQKALGEEITITGWFDRSQILKSRINLLLKSAAQGGFLVILSLALFLDIALAFWVIIGIPFAILGTIAAIQFLGLPVSINVISVFAFILVLGLLVDDGIVTAESAYSTLSKDQQGVESIVKGVRRVAIVTIFGALTSALAFIPSLFLTDGFARAMSQIGYVVIFCVIFSLIETKLILPAHLCHLKMHKKRSIWIVEKIRSVQRYFSNGLQYVAKKPYSWLLKRAVAHRYTTLAIFVAVLILSLAVVQSGIVRFVFFPNVASDQINIEVTTPYGTSWQKTHAIAQQIEAAARKMDERFKAKNADGKYAIKWLNVVSDTDNAATINIELITSEERDISSVVLAQWLREELGVVDGVRSLSIDARAGPAGLPLDIELIGSNLDDLRQEAQSLKLELAQVNGVQDIRDTLDIGGLEISIQLSPEGEALGLGDVELAQQVRQAFFGAEIQRIQREKHEIKVYARLPVEERSRLASVESIWISLPDGRKVPFSVVGTVSTRNGLSEINRINRQRVVNVQADIDKAAVVPAEVIAIVNTQILPEFLSRYPEIKVHLGGEVEEERKSRSALWLGLIVVLLLIFAAMAIPLKSYTQPLLIMSVIPFGIAGAILGHLLLGKDISILSVIGIIGLIGVVVNDSLVMVDFINQDIAKGYKWLDAVLRSGSSRFRAVILTSLTTFFGLLPIQLETSIQSEFVKPMAISVAFGVLLATFVTLLLVPVVYVIGKDIQALCSGKKPADHALIG